MFFMLYYMKIIGRHFWSGKYLNLVSDNTIFSDFDFAPGDSQKPTRPRLVGYPFHPLIDNGVKLYRIA